MAKKKFVAGKEGVRLYETVFIARQDIAASEAEALGTQFGDVITELGGTVLKTESWGLRSLAYKVNKSKKGHYTLINFEAKNDVVTELERKYRLHEDVVRYMTLTVDSWSKEPSAILKTDDRDDRRDRRAA